VPKGATVVDPFIEYDEIRRQKLIVDKCEQIFLKRNEMPPIAGFCNSCSRINFEGIYKDYEISLRGSTVFSLQDIGIIDETWSQRTCRLCRFFAAIWEANKFYLRSARLCLVVLSSRNISKYPGLNQIPKAIRHHNILLLSHPQPQRFFEVDPTTLSRYCWTTVSFKTQAGGRKVHLRTFHQARQSRILDRSKMASAL
jgi:hypothetical protein